MIFLNKCKMFSWTRRRNSKKNGYKPIKEERLCEIRQEEINYPYRGMLSYPGMLSYSGMLSYPGMYNPYGLGLYRHRIHIGRMNMGIYGNDIIW
jgi:hypothetical protein